MTSPTPSAGARKSYTEALIGRDISMKEAGGDRARDYQGQLERVFNEVRELEKHGVQPSESVESDQMIRGLAIAVPSLLARTAMRSSPCRTASLRARESNRRWRCRRCP